MERERQQTDRTLADGHCQGGACCTDCRGVVTVPSNAAGLADIKKNVEFFSLAHFSALIPAGSVRVKSQRGAASHRRDCHFADALSAFTLKRLLKVEGGAVE